MMNESDIVVLLNSKCRHNLTMEAMKTNENLLLKPVFSPVDKEAELAQIINKICPKNMKNSLMSGTVMSHLRKQHRIRLADQSNSVEGRCNSELASGRAKNFSKQPYENESQTTRQYSSEAISKKKQMKSSRG